MTRIGQSTKQTASKTSIAKFLENLVFEYLFENRVHYTIIISLRFETDRMRLVIAWDYL